MDNMEATISKAELTVSSTPEDHSDGVTMLNNPEKMLAD